MSRLATWADVVPYLGDPNGSDTTSDLSDDAILAAIAVDANSLGAAVLLSEWHGRTIAAPDVRRRIAASPRMQRAQAFCAETQAARAIANCFKAIGERNAERQRVLEGWHQLHNERVLASELRRQRNEARCGARTRTGEPCQRKPVLGKVRCPNHGGLSTGPTSLEGKLRSPANLQLGRERRTRK